jgi:hypothetical protein
MVATYVCEKQGCELKGITVLGNSPKLQIKDGKPICNKCHSPLKATNKK